MSLTSYYGNWQGNGLYEPVRQAPLHGIEYPRAEKARKKLYKLNNKRIHELVKARAIRPVHTKKRASWSQMFQIVDTR